MCIAANRPFDPLSSEAPATRGGSPAPGQRGVCGSAPEGYRRVGGRGKAPAA